MTLISKGIVIGFLACCALALAGCSSMLSGGTRDRDTGISSKIEEPLEASLDVKVRQVHVKTREGVVYRTGVVDRSAAMQQDAERIARDADGVTDFHNELVFGKATS